ncbi:MAG: hypothetical protein CVV47_15935 [Spirochaetae bacterium HGW-Spirochaetae-3]|jgi:hypothetical protein|nr:MAG: hypothetical protein CVV47_15935 [Spirochaetae bacterium HGW-Spirochaetae-3]
MDKRSVSVRGTSLDDEPLDDELGPEPSVPSGATPAPVFNRESPAELRSRIRALERGGTRQPLRHRIALIGAAELDEARPRATRSGILKLLEAVYERGEEHWLDPAAAMAPLREILFKEEAPPGADRGLYFILTRLARAGISPAAFTLHVIMPRMAADYDWRRWRSRHVWVLGSIADMLISLRADPPWNEARLGSSPVLTDVALCKYVGRPLARIAAERFAAQEGPLASWMDAWKRFTFSSSGFLTFMRRIVLPCLYRMSGRIDPEQLAPIARSLADLERTLGRRISAMSPAVAESFLSSAGLSDSFEARMERRAAAGTAAAGAFSLAQEIRGYAELASELANLDAGPAVLGRAAAISLNADSGYLLDAATLVRALRRDEGAALARWHLEDLARIGPAERARYIAIVAANAGVHPLCPYARPPAPFSRRNFDADALALALGLDIGPLRSGDGSPPDLATMRRAYLAGHPDAAELYAEISGAVAKGEDRSWDAVSARRFDAPGPGFHELALRSLIPGIGTGFSSQELKERSMKALFDRYGEASSGTAADISVDLRIELSDEAGKGVDAAGRDAVRARIAVDVIEAAWRAIVSGEGDPECGAVFAELGREAAAARKRLADLRTGPTGDDSLDAAGEKPADRSRSGVRALEARLSLMDVAFESMKVVSPTGRDPRRFALAVHLAAYFFKPGTDAAFGALAGAAARYATDPSFSTVAARLASDVAPGFMGVEQAAVVADAVDALCAACAADKALAAALEKAEGDLSDALRGSSRIKGGAVSRESMDAALRRIAAYARVTAETAKWRDLLVRLETAKAPRKGFSLRTSRSFLDAYYGDMGGICLSAKPELILRPGVLVARLWDVDESRIRGMCLFVFSQGPARSAGIGKFWYAFAFNPLRSLLRGMGTKEIAALYLGFRALAEELSARSGLPVLVPGIGPRGPSSHGVVSNDGAFETLVANYEISAGSPRVSDASGFSIYYSKAAFTEAVVAIDPRRPESYRAVAELRAMGAYQGRREG